MRRFMRSILVALLVVMMTISPATACHYCGGYGGGGYYSTGGYYGGGSCCQGVYYSSSCCGGSYQSSCCGGEVVVSEGCSNCGGCSDCGACEGCGSEGCATCGEQNSSSTQAQPTMAAPEPPANHSQSVPSTVNRIPTEPAPSLAPQSMPSTSGTEMRAMPSTKPSVEPPAVMPDTTMPESAPATTAPERYAPATTTPATEPSTSHDDLFGTPSTETKPLPAVEPATPAESDSLFGAPAEKPTTDSAPATPSMEPTAKPTTEPAAPPSDNDLFGAPAEEAKPADKPAEEAKPGEEKKKDDNDDLFGNTEAILGMPGGLASHDLRHWVDDSGSFSCEGRLIRVLDGKVQLRKANGHTTTVPLARLSRGDLEFVNRQASAQKAEAIGKTAQVSPNWAN